MEGDPRRLPRDEVKLRRRMGRVGELARASARGVRLALAWRGPDSSGVRLQTWLLVLAAALVLARLLAPVVPAVTLAPPVLALAVAVPALRAMGARFQERMGNRAVRALELAAVGLYFAGCAWVLWPHVLRGIVPIDTGDHQFMMGR